MSGVKGRSGRRPKPLALHLRDGTFRPDRHGPMEEAIRSVSADVLSLASAPAPPPPTRKRDSGPSRRAEGVQTDRGAARRAERPPRAEIAHPNDRKR